MDEERFHKRLESLEDAEKETAITLARLCSRIESEQGNNTRHIELLYKMVERHDHILIGDGNGLIGMATRIDRIEQVAKIRSWNLKIIWTTLLGFLIKIVYDFFTWVDWKNK